MAPLLAVSALVLVATTATVTWLLANPEVESKPSTEEVVSTASEVKAESAPAPPPLSFGEGVPNETKGSAGPAPKAPALDDGSGGRETGADGGTTGVVDGADSSGEAGTLGDETTDEGGKPVQEVDGNASGAKKAETRSDAPPTPTMTIRVARKKETGPLWVWAGGRWHSIDKTTYVVIPKVPEGSYVYWNTTKTKKGAKKQKVGKRKKGKIWNLVITPTGMQELYLDA